MPFLSRCNGPHDTPVWIEEIFGPALATTTFENEAEAIALATASDYGLEGAVVSGNWDRAKRVADQILAG